MEKILSLGGGLPIMDKQNTESVSQPKKGNSPVFWGLILIFAAIFLVCGFIVIKYYMGSQDHKQLQEEVVDLYSTTSRIPLPTSPSTGNGTTGTTAPNGNTGTTGTTAPNGNTGSTGTTGTTAANRPTFGTTSPADRVMLEDMRALFERNPHVVGWIYIPGTESAYQKFSGINYPVLQTPNKPGWYDYYLDRNFDGEKDDHGWIYVREACDVFAPCDNIVIYGHNMADGTMFGQVVNYRNQSYYQNHKYIYFDTLYEHQLYEIIAVFHTSGAGDGYPYHTKNNFRNEAEFNEFMNAIKGGDSRVKLFYNIETTAQYGDRLITLSTCWDAYPYPDGRWVVVAKRIV